MTADQDLLGRLRTARTIEVESGIGTRYRWVKTLVSIDAEGDVRTCPWPRCGALNLAEAQECLLCRRVMDGLDAPVPSFAEDGGPVVLQWHEGPREGHGVGFVAPGPAGEVSGQIDAVSRRVVSLADKKI